MTRLSQFIATLLIATVLGSTQCVESCSLISLERPQQTAAEPAMPCHPDSSQPSGDEKCSPHETVAENPSAPSTSNHFQPASLASFRLEATILATLTLPPSVMTHTSIPKPHPGSQSPILRI